MCTSQQIQSNGQPAHTAVEQEEGGGILIEQDHEPLNLHAPR